MEAKHELQAAQHCHADSLNQVRKLTEGLQKLQSASKDTRDALAAEVGGTLQHALYSTGSYSVIQCCTVLQYSVTVQCHSCLWDLGSCLFIYENRYMRIDI